MKNQVDKYLLHNNGFFPNSKFPVLHYLDVLQLPILFPTRYAEKLFLKNDWANNWRSGIYTYHHYHSITHEVMGVVKGKITLLIGGEDGLTVNIAGVM